MNDLSLEVEFLAGVSFAAAGPDTHRPEWPPQPDRVFSALVATWAARGRQHDEAEALEWLERLPAPMLLATPAEPRTAATVFVPPNDPRLGRSKHAAGVLPALRRRQPRRFPAVRPHNPFVRLIWKGSEAGDNVLQALNALAADTSYVGHSSSLTRCRFAAGTIDLRGSVPAVRSVYAGRFAELKRDFDTGRRPSRGSAARPTATPRKVAQSAFDGRWLILEHLTAGSGSEGVMPDLRGCGIVARKIRDSILSGYRRIGSPDRIPEVVSGHTSEGAPTRVAHLAIVPLAFVGFPHADGHVLGYALVPPRGSGLLDDEDFRSALRAVAPIDESRGRRVMHIFGTGESWRISIELSPTLEPSRRSLEPAAYIAPARTFATATPIVLDRHLKKTGAGRQIEMEEQIAQACLNAGLPKAEWIRADKHSALEGAPSAYPSGGSPHWMRWQLPRALASRQLTHAMFRFPEPVEGPVLLGAGRYVGMGLCLPIGGESDGAES